MKELFWVASTLVLALLPGCGPGAESELKALGANCLSSTPLTGAAGGVDGATLAELIEACNQRVLSLNTTDTAAEP
jgi:hypothetical protein